MLCAVVSNVVGEMLQYLPLRVREQRLDKVDVRCKLAFFQTRSGLSSAYVMLMHVKDVKVQSCVHVDFLAEGCSWRGHS